MEKLKLKKKYVAASGTEICFFLPYRPRFFQRKWENFQRNDFGGIYYHACLLKDANFQET